MKQLVTILLLVSQFVYAETLDEDYNECKSQLYLLNGNGIFASSSKDAKHQTFSNFNKFRKKNRDITTDLKIDENLLAFKQSAVYYSGDANSNIDWLASKFHLLKQLLVEHKGSYRFFAIMNYLKSKNNSVKPNYYAGTQQQWEELKTIYDEASDDDRERFKNYISNFDVFEDPLLLEHLHNYRESINLGNAVSTVGHSQGALYANFAYDVLINEGDMGSYYNVSAFGTVADRVASAQGNMRNGSDEYVLDENDDSRYLSMFGHLPFNATNTNIAEDISTHIFPSYINGNDTAPKIYTMIKNQLQENIDRSSRWSILEESDEVTKKGTSAYRVKIVYGDKTVEKVLPFGIGDKDKVRYLSIKGSDKKILIKGSCQATSIIDHTNDTPDNELIVNGEKVLYELEGTEEYIFGEKTCKDPSLFEVVSQENKNTANWRVSVKNKETDEITEGVYPFNLQGSLYQLDSGEWVLASCGATEILYDWQEKKEYELMMLDNPQKEKIEKGRFERDAENAIVIDFKTGLEWQDESATWLDSWYGGRQHCETLLLGGYDDWRLPTFNELVEIVDPKGPPYVYDTFEYLREIGYWSLDKQGVFPDTEEAKVLNFKRATWIFINTSQQMNTRCVRTH